MSEKEGAPTTIEIPIFPLPNVVFFPRTLLPLHIFEPRYKTMLSEVMQGDRRIGMVLQRVGSGGQLSGTQIHAIGGLGQVREAKELSDGTFDIVLNGLSRFRIVDVVTQEPYHRAAVEVLPELYREQPKDHEMGQELVARYRDFAGKGMISEKEIRILRRSDLATVANSICSLVPISPSDRQLLLELDDIRARAEAALAVIRHLNTQKEFVEQFSHMRPGDPSLN